MSILKALRKAGNPTPVLLLTARIHALQRRISGERQNILADGDLRLDRISREVHWHDHSVDLTGREFSLIEYLMRSPGRVFTRTQILEHVYSVHAKPPVFWSNDSALTNPQTTPR